MLARRASAVSPKLERRAAKALLLGACTSQPHSEYLMFNVTISVRVRLVQSAFSMSDAAISVILYFYFFQLHETAYSCIKILRGN